MHTKLAMSFLTYNREKHVAESLSRIVKTAAKLKINIYIFDGSTNNATENVVNTYITKGYQNIYYFHEFEKDLSKNMRQRFVAAFTIPDADYIWLCGDKFLIAPSNYELFLHYIDQSYDIICSYDRCLNGTRYFLNPVKFVDYTIVPMTHFGSVIIKKELIMNLKVDMLSLLQEHLGFTHVYMYMCAIEKKEFKGIALHINPESFQILSRYSTMSLSTSRMWITWIKQWYFFVSNIPKRYKKIENSIVNRLDRELGFFSFTKLLQQRVTGQFDIKRCIEYRKYVKKVVIMPYFFVCVIALLPREVAKILQVIFYKY